jgi:hypothetical protein
MNVSLKAYKSGVLSDGWNKYRIPVWVNHIILFDDRVSTVGVWFGLVVGFIEYLDTQLVTTIHRIVFSVTVFTALLDSALGFRVQRLLSSLADTLQPQLPSWTNSRRTIDSLCGLGTDRVEYTYHNSSCVVASRSYRHWPRREHCFPVTPLLRVTKLLPNNGHVCGPVP